MWNFRFRIQNTLNFRMGSAKVLSALRPSELRIQRLNCPGSGCRIYSLRSTHLRITRVDMASLVQVFVVPYISTAIFQPNMSKLMQ
jgi:hypothetical protein